MFRLLIHLVCLCSYTIKGLNKDHKVLLTLFSHINDDIFLSKEWVHWCHGVWDYFLCTDHQQAAVEMIWRVSYCRCLHCTSSFWHSTFRNCATVVVFFFSVLVFSNLWLFFPIILDCWCFIYEFLRSKFTPLVQIII